MSDIENWNEENGVPNDAEQLTCKTMFFTTATGKQEIVMAWDDSQEQVVKEKSSSGWACVAIFVVGMCALHLLRELFVSVTTN